MALIHLRVPQKSSCWLGLSLLCTPCQKKLCSQGITYPFSLLILLHHACKFVHSRAILSLNAHKRILTSYHWFLKRWYILKQGVLSNGNVAVKRIRNNHTIDEKLFYREVDSLMGINHQNIVRFVGFCASTDQIAIQIKGSSEHIYAEIRERLLCFEYISNGSLQKYITDELRGLDWSTRYRLIKGICDGVHYLHTERHIYHMDLKPANILVDNDMVPKITDFGLSRLDEKSQTMSLVRCGSLGYCAPESLQCGKMSFKSDRYSLGIIIMDLVTGEKIMPDENKNNERVLLTHHM
jgi:serine/threonine protein kinase